MMGPMGWGPLFPGRNRMGCGKFDFEPATKAQSAKSQTPMLAGFSIDRTEPAAMHASRHRLVFSPATARFKNSTKLLLPRITQRLLDARELIGASVRSRSVRIIIQRRVAQRPRPSLQDRIHLAVLLAVLAIGSSGTISPWGVEQGFCELPFGRSLVLHLPCAFLSTLDYKLLTWFAGTDFALIRKASIRCKGSKCEY